MSKTGLVIIDYLLWKSLKEVLKAILHDCLVVCNYLYLQTLDYWTILYIALGHFHCNANGVYFFVKKKRYIWSYFIKSLKLTEWLRHVHIKY